MQKEVVLALQLHMTAMVSLFAEKKLMDREEFLELCRHTIAETQHASSDTDWSLVKALIEGASLP